MSFPQRDYLGELFRGYASVCQYPVSIVSFTDRASQAHKLRFDPIMMMVPISNGYWLFGMGPRCPRLPGGVSSSCWRLSRECANQREATLGGFRRVLAPATVDHSCIALHSSGKPTWTTAHCISQFEDGPETDLKLRIALWSEKLMTL